MSSTPSRPPNTCSSGSRSTKTNASGDLDIGDKETYTKLKPPHPDSARERKANPLFPSPHRFEIVLHEYLSRLSPKKREKALLTQKMYDAVLAVLQDPKDTTTKTAQFRFWAKKMFGLTNYGGDIIVCHEGKPVAVKEQIYEVLVHCHDQAGHGGRDKTSYQVRKFYSWIPKEVIARFVKECPFCQSRRTQASPTQGMSESQAFLISLQSSDTQSNDKRPITLQQARANAAALGHKPFRRSSHRTLDQSRPRRESGMIGDGATSTGMNGQGYINYNDPPMPDFALPSNFAPIVDFQSNQVQNSRPAAPHPYARRGQSFQVGPAYRMPEFPRRASADATMTLQNGLQPHQQQAYNGNGVYLPLPQTSTNFIASRTSMERGGSTDSLEDVRRLAQSVILAPGDESGGNNRYVDFMPALADPNCGFQDPFAVDYTLLQDGGCSSSNPNYQLPSQLDPQQVQQQQQPFDQRFLSAADPFASLPADMQHWMQQQDQEQQLDPRDISAALSLAALPPDMQNWQQQQEQHLHQRVPSSDPFASLPSDMQHWQQHEHQEQHSQQLIPSPDPFASLPSGMQNWQQQLQHLDQRDTSVVDPFAPLPPDLQNWQQQSQQQQHPRDTSAIGSFASLPLNTQNWQPASDQQSLPHFQMGQLPLYDANNMFALGEAAGMSQDQVEAIHETNPGFLGELHQQFDAMTNNSAHLRHHSHGSHGNHPVAERFDFLPKVQQRELEVQYQYRPEFDASTIHSHQRHSPDSSTVSGIAPFDPDSSLDSHMAQAFVKDFTDALTLTNLGQDLSDNNLGMTVQNLAPSGSLQKTESMEGGIRGIIGQGQDQTQVFEQIQFDPQAWA